MWPQVPAQSGLLLAVYNKRVRAAGFSPRIFFVLSLKPKCLSNRLSARRTVEQKWFFTALSVRPDNYLAMSFQRLPSSAWAAKRRASSQRLQGALVMAGESWLYQRSRICLEERAWGRRARICRAIAVHWPVPCSSISPKMTSSYCITPDVPLASIVDGPSFPINDCQDILTDYTRNHEASQRRNAKGHMIEGFHCGLGVDDGLQLKMSLQAEVDSTLETLIGKTHQLLASNFTLLDGTRDLDAQENALLLQLDPQSAKYRQVAGVLAIQSYVKYVISLMTGCEPLLELTAVIFQGLAQARQYAQEYSDEELQGSLEQAWSNLGKLAEVTHKLFPNSPLVGVHRGFMDEEGGAPSETIYARLYDENLELKGKLEQNDRQLLELELKLTKLLQEHDGCEGNVDSSLKLLQLREKLAAREEEIDRMNEEFSFQIEKYNTVYEAMKREIEELKDYNSTDLYEMVERLETEIVKLREEKQRDEIIIRELKERVGYPTATSHIRKPNTYSRVYY